MDAAKPSIIAADKARVLIVDDHPVVRQGLSALIEQSGDLTVCGQAGDAKDALVQLHAVRPDVVLLDLSLQEANGIDVMRDMLVQMPSLPILVLSMMDETYYAERVLRAGGRGYVMKGEAMDTVLSAVHCVLRGEIFLSPAMSARLVAKLVRGPSERNSVDLLSDRELEVFEMIGAGLSTRDISERLHLSIKTVESHREHIKGKLNFAGSSELLRHAIQWVQAERAG
jgi:DNA-binding NarL/FixJ family response regulator